MIGVPLTVMVSPAAKLVRQRIRCRGAGQQRRAGDRRRHRGLVVDRTSGDRRRRIEEIVRCRDRRCRDQRRVAQRLDRGRQCGLQVRGGRRRVDADQERARRRRICRRRGQRDRLAGAVGQIEVERDLVAIVRIDGAEIDGHGRRRAGRLRHGRAGQRRTDRSRASTRTTNRPRPGWSRWSSTAATRPSDAPCCRRPDRPAGVR